MAMADLIMSSPHWQDQSAAISRSSLRRLSESDSRMRDAAVPLQKSAGSPSASTPSITGPPWAPLVSGRRPWDPEGGKVNRIISTSEILAVGGLGKLLLRILNRTTVFDHDKLLSAVKNRDNDRGLLTVCNHMSTLDDPFLMSSILPASMLANLNYVRWSLCAEDMCFFNPIIGAIFRNGKVLPIKRGGGLEQEELHVATNKLREGAWVHIFPEGKVYQNGTVGPCRKGVGKIATTNQKIPTIVPFVHSGMEEVYPLDTLFPTFGKKVFVLVGDPIKIDDIVNHHRRLGSSRDVLYKAVADRVEQEMAELVEKLKRRKQLYLQSRR